MSRLLLVDLDHTMVASPRCDPTPEVIAAWESEIIANPPPPVPGAIEGFRREARSADRVCFVTARSRRLEAASVEWIRSCLPVLEFRLSMGFYGADSGGRIHKAARIGVLVNGWPRVTLIDDDEEMRNAIRPCDTFLHAPGCWR